MKKLCAVLLILFGVGMGTFAAPNTAAIMNAVPAQDRGVSSGMRATFQNVGNTLSITLIFTLVIVGLSSSLPGSLVAHLTASGVPASVAEPISHIPPIGAMFAGATGEGNF